MLSCSNVIKKYDITRFRIFVLKEERNSPIENPSDSPRAADKEEYASFF